MTGPGGAVARRLIEGNANRWAPSNIRHDAYGGRIDAEAELADGSDLRTRLLDHRVVVDHDGRTHATGRPRASTMSAAPTASER